MKIRLHRLFKNWLMSEPKLVFEFDNTFIPPFVSNELKWYERDGLETWYRQNKCQEFLENTDKYFEQRKIVNFDLIRNGERLDKEIIRQYQTVDYNRIKTYPPKYHQQITSSIFRNVNHNDLHVNNQTIKEHFSNKKTSIGRGKFLKKCRDDMYAACW